MVSRPHAALLVGDAGGWLGRETCAGAGLQVSLVNLDGYVGCRSRLELLEGRAGGGMRIEGGEWMSRGGVVFLGRCRALGSHEVLFERRWCLKGKGRSCWGGGWRWLGRRENLHSEFFLVEKHDGSLNTVMVTESSETLLSGGGRNERDARRNPSVSVEASDEGGFSIRTRIYE